MVIFSASPIGVFQQSFLISAAFIVLGALGLLVALFRWLRRRRNWFGLALACIFVVVIGVVYAGLTIKNMSTSTQSVTARMDKKAVVQESCEQGYNCNNDYVISMTSAPNSYDFTVAKSAYDSMKKGQCYQVTYYPSVGLFSSSADTGSGAYISTSYITNITQMDPSACG